MADWLCTLAQAKAEIKADASQTVNDDWVIANIPLVSTRINNLTRLRFVPYIQQHYYDAFGTFIDDVQRKLDLGRPILLPTAVHDAFGNDLVYGTDYVCTPQDGPFYQLQLISQTVYGWSYGFGFGTYFWIAPGQFLRAIQITGHWGYRANYPAEGWTNSLQALTTTLNATDTVSTFGVTDPNGYDANALAPAISVGNVLQMNGEWMQTVAVNASSKEVTAVRAINGSTIATHSTTTPVYTWSVQPEITRAAARWIAYWYSRRGAFEAVKNDLSSAGAKTYVYPEDAPAEVLRIIEQTRDWRWASV
jgi:hypothetical protein